MSEYEWKPGDVALVTVRELAGSKQHVGLCYLGGRVSTGAAEDVARWTLADRTEAWSSVIDARPLVVVDPEGSRGIAVEIAQRVGSALHVTPGRDISAGIGAVQAVLREFANPTPPKPDEPQGLGAVVEDVDGQQWVRAGRSHGGRLTDNWRGVDGGDLGGWWSEWKNIKAVRVLSEGVQ